MAEKSLRWPIKPIVGLLKLGAYLALAAALNPRLGWLTIAVAIWLLADFIRFVALNWSRWRDEWRQMMSEVRRG